MRQIRQILAPPPGARVHARAHPYEIARQRRHLAYLARLADSVLIYEQNRRPPDSRQIPPDAYSPPSRLRGRVPCCARQTVRRGRCEDSNRLAETGRAAAIPTFVTTRRAQRGRNRTGVGGRARSWGNRRGVPWRYSLGVGRPCSCSAAVGNPTTPGMGIHSRGRTSLAPRNRSLHAARVGAASSRDCAASAAMQSSLARAATHADIRSAPSVAPVLLPTRSHTFSAWSKATTWAIAGTLTHAAPASTGMSTMTASCSSQGRCLQVRGPAVAVV